MQRYLVSFVLTGDPNTYASGSTGNLSTIDSWHLYGSEEQVFEFQLSGAGFNISGDELDSARVVFWNKPPESAIYI
ncbi:hypothetical protein B9479_004703 [Cryptococcus floricola]|uniref:Carboxylesterase type B domain-containing protein n=1 Tax=Cryptococcus floricola TaxID=2591691 RepID=A0A5D3AWN7_9TREE|nr:hypothetical protein B9479_004703 [Cryptococcus floricola]